MSGWPPRAERFRYLPPEPVLRTSLPWVVALMVLLATLGTAAGIALATGVGAVDRELGDELTVQVVDGNPDRLEERTQRITAMLAGDDRVAAVRPLSDEELEGLLEPWLGGAEVGEVVPIPQMIDVAIAPGASAAAVAAEVRQADTDAIVDLHSDWFAPLGRVGIVLAVLALASAVLLAAAMAAVIVLGVRAGLGRHREALDILHLLGAEDRVVTGLFQYRLAMTAMVGAAGGFVLALFVIVLLARLLSEAGSGIIGAAALPVWGWPVLAAVPLVAVTLAVLTTRWTVDGALKERI